MISQLGLRYRGRRYSDHTNCICATPARPASLSRRAMLTGIAAVGAASALPKVSASAALGAIDVHHHMYPPRYLADSQEQVAKDLGPALLSLATNWSPAAAIEKMDRAGVATAINSMTTPGVWFDDGEAGRTRSRICNEFGAQLMRDFPGRFGMFAAIPLPDIEGSLREVTHALDVLKLDGVGLLTSYAGALLGDPQFAPVFDELNRRKAVVFVHPTMSCCGSLGLDPHTIELPTDTTRTITSLLFGGTFARCQDIRFIFSHGGGVLTSIVTRILGAAARMKPEERAAKLPNGAEYELQRQYYDFASIGMSPAGVSALRKLFPNSQLLYGSDEPFLSGALLTERLSNQDFSAAELQAIRRDNAARLLPRLQT
jgi:6-methylsalicylate decarboxylase